MTSSTPTSRGCYERLEAPPAAGPTYPESIDEDGRACGPPWITASMAGVALIAISATLVTGLPAL